MALDDILSVAAEIDLKDWDAPYQKLRSDTDYLDNLSDVAISASVEVSDDSFSSIEALDGTEINVAITPEITDDAPVADLEALDGETIVPEISPDLTDETPITDIEALDGAEIEPSITPTITDETPLTELDELNDASIEPEISPHETDEGKATIDAINRLSALHAIQLAISVVGNALDFINSFKDFLLTPITDLDSGMAKFGAQTGVTGDELQAVGDTLKQLHQDDLGENVGQITDVAIAAKQAGLDIDEAARASLTFTHTFTDANPIDVMNTLSQLVSQGLAPNLAEAGDLLTVAFQNGANKGGDLLATLNENAVAFHDLGLTGDQALSAINSLIAGGIPTAGEAARALTDLDKSLGAAAANPTSDTNSLLRRLGVDNPKEDGKAIGADYLDGLVEAIKNAPPDIQEQATSALFGKQGTKNTSALLNLDVSDDSFSNVAGASEKAATAADDSFSGAVDDFKLSLETIAQDFLSSDQIDLPGKLSAIKTGLQEAADVLVNGGTFESAIKVTLQSIGLDDDFERLEGSIGDFVIGVEQAIASILDALGHGKEAAGIRSQVAEQGQTQLAFNLKTANPDEIAGQISTAVSRGVTAEGITSAVGTAVDELVKNGATAQAQAIVDAANQGGSIHFEVTDPVAKKILEGQGQDTAFDLPITPEMSPEAIEKLKQDTLDQFNANGFALDANVVPSVSQDDLDALQKQIDNATTTKEGFKGFDTVGGTNPTPTSGAVEPAVSDGFHAFGGALDTVTTATTDLTEKVDAQGTAVTTAAAASDTLTTSAGNMTTSVTDASDATSDMAVSTQDAATAAQDASDAQILLGGSFAEQAAELAELQAQLDAGKISLDQFNTSLQALIDSAMAAAGQGGIPTINHNNTNVNNTFNTSSQAEGTSAGQQVANQVNGQP